MKKSFVENYSDWGNFVEWEFHLEIEMTADSRSHILQPFEILINSNQNANMQSERGTSVKAKKSKAG